MLAGQVANCSTMDWAGMGAGAGAAVVVVMGAMMDRMAGQQPTDGWQV